MKNNDILNEINNLDLDDNVTPFGASEETKRIPSPKVITRVVDAIEAVIKYPPF